MGVEKPIAAMRSPLGVPAYMRGFNETWTEFGGLRRCSLHYTTEPYKGSSWVCPECIKLDRRWERDTRDD